MMQQTPDTMRPKLIAGVVGSGIASLFCGISMLAVMLPPKSAEPEPEKMLGLTVLYAWLGARNSRNFFRSWNLVSLQDNAPVKDSYNCLSRTNGTLAMTAASYAVRAFSPEVAAAHLVIDATSTVIFGLGALHCKRQEKALNAPQGQ